MTPLEDLLREALASTPEPSPSTDPIGTLDRRVRRARRRLAASAGVVAAAIAVAIVVPLTVTGGGAGKPGSISVVTPPTEQPSPPPPGTTVLAAPDALWVAAAPAGGRWLLRQHTGGDYYVAQLGPGGLPGEGFTAPAPADYILPGDNVVWVVGDGGPGQAVSRISAVDVRKGHVAIRTFYPGQHLGFGAVIGDYLFVDVSNDAGDQVEVFQLDGDRIKDFASRSVPRAAEMVVAGGAIWVHSGDKLVELFLSERGIDPGVTVPWGTGPMFAPTLPRTGQDGVWAYDGSRLIGLMPKALSGCLSCAEGDRVTVPGKPNAVVEAQDGLYVAVPGSGLYYYSPDALGAGETPVTASIKGVQVITMTADPTGGVDYVDDQGQLIRWDPTCQDAHATTCA